MNALIIEDELIIAAALESILEKNNITVLDKITTQEKAIKSILSYEPDLAIVDINLLDNGSGLKVINTCKYKVKTSYLIITGYKDKYHEEIEELKYPYLLKPFLLSDVIEKVNYIKIQRNK